MDEKTESSWQNTIADCTQGRIEVALLVLTGISISCMTDMGGLTRNMPKLYSGKKHNKEKIVFLILGTVLFCCLTKIFYCQAIKFNGEYYSDLPEHIEIAMTGAGYSVLYWIMGWVCSFKGEAFFLIAMLESFIVVLTWLMSAKVIKRLVPMITDLNASLYALPITFLTGIYVPCIYESFYKLQLVTQPYHNITYYGMRLLAIGSFYVFTDMFDRYLEKIKITDYIVFSLLLMLATWIKPSYFYGFALTLLVFLVTDLIRCKFNKTHFFNIIIMGTTVFPSLIIMFLQARVLYGAGDGSSGIALICGARFIEENFQHTILKLICNFSFPFIVWLMNRKEMLRTDKFVYTMFIVQFLIAISFTETGVRANHGNFYWGLFIGSYFLFIVAVSIFLKSIEEKKNGRFLYRVASIFLMLAHLISSCVYFIYILMGGNYKI